MVAEARGRKGDEPMPKKGAEEILRSEIREGMVAQSRGPAALFISGLSAGLDVGFSVLLMAVMWGRCHGKLPTPVTEILIANMYAIGFVFVIVGRSELFTEQTTLAVLPMLSGQTTFRSLLRLWVLVYAANLLGGLGFSWIAANVGPGLGMAPAAAFGVFAHRMIDHSKLVIFGSALLAGWLMGLLSWLVAASRDTISQIVFVWLVTTCIGFANLHHVVLGTVEVLSGMFAGQGITGAEFSKFLIWTTLGNIVGGSCFVALVKYGDSRPEHK